MEQIYFIGMPIYFVFYLIFMTFAIRYKHALNPDADEFLITYGIAIGVFSVFIWPAVLATAVTLFAVIGLFRLISKSIERV